MDEIIGGWSVELFNRLRVALAMRWLADIMIFFGAILLTLGTDLVIATAGTASTVGGPLGVIASLIGVALLTAGILNHYRLTLALRFESDADGRETASKREKPEVRRR
ncbi:MAG: hypothetical protein ACREQE_05910 [Candidatus Binataceae bacterium]